MSSKTEHPSYYPLSSSQSRKKTVTMIYAVKTDDN